MTGQRPNNPARRLGDRGIVGRFQTWWWGVGQPILGIFVLLLGVGLFVVGLEVRGFSESRARDAAVVRQLAEQNAKQQAATAKAARISCNRSRQFGPVIADFYEKNGLNPRLIVQYRASIPKVCPGDKPKP